MNIMDKLAKELKSQITAADERKPKAYDTQAEVVRIEDDTAWVHIPGGVTETPVRLTINAKKGDMVNVHVANGAAWITGNSTNPPTDDSTAIELNQKTSKNLFVLNERVTNEFNNAWTEITQNSEEIKLKASQDSVDDLSGRVTTAESSIEQNAHDITLKVSSTDYTGDKIVSKINLQPDTVKIEAKNVAIDGTATFNAISDKVQGVVDDLQIGGRNLVRALDETKMTVTKLGCSYTYKDGEYVLTCTTADGGSNFTQIYSHTNADALLFNNVSPGDTVIFHVDSVVSSNTALDPRIYLDVRKADGTYIATKGIYKAANNWVNKFEIPAEAARYTLIIRMDQNKNAAVGDTLTVSGLKLERGNKATDWTPAPEDVQAEIDAKKSVHTLASSLSFTYANLLTYSNEGYSKSGGWTVSDANGVKVGDTVRIKVTASDMDNASVYVVGTVTAVSGNIVTMTSHGLDTTVIDGGHILTGTIDASKVNVSNLTVGAFGSTEQNKILNSEIQVGGRNLFRNSMFQGSTAKGVTVSHTSGSEYINITGTSTAAGDIIIANLSSIPTTNATVTISTNSVFTNSSTTYFYVSTTKDNKWYKNYEKIAWYSATERRLTITLENGETLRYLVLKMPSGAEFNGNFRFKVELGNKQTDWSPAPEDVDADIDGAAKTATNYVTTIDNNDGIQVHAQNNPTSNYVKINADGMDIYRSGESLAAFTADGMRIGKDDEKHIVITASEFNVYDEDGSVPFSISTSNSKKTASGGLYSSVGGTSSSYYIWMPLVYLRGTLTDNRIYLGASQTGAPTDYSSYIELADNPATFPSPWSSTITIEGVKCKARYYGQSVLQVSFENTTATKKYMGLRYTQEYYDTYIRVDDAALEVKHIPIALVDSVGVSVPYSACYMRTYGHIATLHISVYNTSSISVGGFIYKGTLLEYPPTAQVNLVGEYSGHPIIGHIDSMGNVSVRNTGRSAITTSSSQAIWLTATYIYK